MSYTCGIAPNMARLGFTPGPPHITCDGCGVKLVAQKSNGAPPAWLLNGKAPPGWKLERTDTGAGRVYRSDWCPRCKSVRP